LEAARLNQGAVPSMTDLRLFEVGRTFRWSYPQPRLQPEQPRKLGLLMRGRRQPPASLNADAMVDAYDLKGAVEAVLAAFSISGVQWRAVGTRWLHPESATAIETSDLVLGAFGRAHPDLLDQYGLEGPPVFLAELDIDALTACRGPDRRNVS